MRTILVVVLLCCFTLQTTSAQTPQSFAGHLDANTETQDFPLTLAAGDAVIIATTTDGSLDTVVTLYNDAGERVAQNDDATIGTQNSRVAYLAQEAGTYTITVSRYDESSSGDFTLDITIGDPSILRYEVTLSGREQTRDSEHFRFHYTETGADAVDASFLDAIVRAFEDAWTIEIDKLGWPAPPDDTAMGGNALYDVYVMDVVGSQDEALGITSPELFVGDNPHTEAVETYASASYIAIDNDFRNVDFVAGQTATTVMRSTAIHEFHHAIQFGFDGAEPHSWMAEATSTWMETMAAGKDQDATEYVSTALQYPELCFGTTAEDSSIMYGEWPFMQMLTDDFGKNAVLELWQQAADYEGFDALGQLLAAHGATVPGEVARYRIKNLARDYKLAPLFHSTVWIENTITGKGTWTHSDTINGVQELGANYFIFAAPAGVYDVELREDNHKLELWAIGVTASEIDAIALGRGGGIDTRQYEDTYLMVFNPTYDNDVEECSATDYSIKVMTGKGTANPVASVWNRTNFEPPQ